jgi:hypothetical protein
MAYTAYDTPGEFFGAGYSLGSNKVSLETATSGGTPVLTQLTDTDANATTGKTQQVVLALVESCYAKYNAIASADRPTNMTITRQSAVNDLTGQRTVNYIVTVIVDASTLTTVRPEA